MSYTPCVSHTDFEKTVSILTVTEGIQLKLLPKFAWRFYHVEWSLANLNPSNLYPWVVWQFGAISDVNYYYYSILLLLLLIIFIHCIYNYIPETHTVSRAYSVAAICGMCNVIPMLNVLYFPNCVCSLNILCMVHDVVF